MKWCPTQGKYPLLLAFPYHYSTCKACSLPRPSRPYFVSSTLRFGFKLNQDYASYILILESKCNQLSLFTIGKENRASPLSNVMGRRPHIMMIYIVLVAPLEIWCISTPLPWQRCLAKGNYEPKIRDPHHDKVVALQALMDQVQTSLSRRVDDCTSPI